MQEKRVEQHATEDQWRTYNLTHVMVLCMDGVQGGIPTIVIFCKDVPRREQNICNVHCHVIPFHSWDSCLHFSLNEWSQKLESPLINTFTSQDTAELDLTFDRVYKWVANSTPDKHAFIQVLWKVSHILPGLVAVFFIYLFIHVIYFLNFCYCSFVFSVDQLTSTTSKGCL